MLTSAFGDFWTCPWYLRGCRSLSLTSRPSSGRMATLCPGGPRSHGGFQLGKRGYPHSWMVYVMESMHNLNNLDNLGVPFHDELETAPYLSTNFLNQCLTRQLQEIIYKNCLVWLPSFTVEHWPLSVRRVLALRRMSLWVVFCFGDAANKNLVCRPWKSFGFPKEALPNPGGFLMHGWSLRGRRVLVCFYHTVDGRNI